MYASLILNCNAHLAFCYCHLRRTIVVTLGGLLIHNQHSFKCHMLVSPTSENILFIATGCRRVTLAVIN